MTAYPTKLTRQGDQQLVIDWSDGEQRTYGVRELRSRCPCATCREQRKQPEPMLPVLGESDTKPLQIDGMKPVGSYAYSIAFSDGHDTGIFTFELLKELGQPQTD